MEILILLGSIVLGVLFLSFIIFKIVLHVQRGRLIHKHKEPSGILYEYEKCYIYKYRR